jgi:hypothetical protein
MTHSFTSFSDCATGRRARVERAIVDDFISIFPKNVFCIEKKFNPNTQNKTITEMIFAPSYLEDGAYLLNLQIPAFVSDAAPSRPIIYKINEL